MFQHQSHNPPPLKKNVHMESLLENGLLGRPREHSKTHVEIGRNVPFNYLKLLYPLTMSKSINHLFHNCIDDSADMSNNLLSKIHQNICVGGGAPNRCLHEEGTLSLLLVSLKPTSCSK